MKKKKMALLGFGIQFGIKKKNTLMEKMFLAFLPLRLSKPIEV